ncbi:HNH endonuclease signature motif containing protein [Burkholderia gladioli]|uniref:HNH endonuclease signature motif containing protein n=1 Tax=Burkholderia gladioli TaxID=28095 RepID=UPI00163FA88E
MIVYGKYGDDLPPCELCGKVLNWRTVHVDHIDENPSNNDPTNLRPLCRGCNVSRTTRIDSVVLTANGISKCASAWARDPQVDFCYRSIIRRKASGMSDFEVLFGKKLTHNGNRVEVRRMKKEAA